jgi:hypothetical protein
MKLMRNLRLAVIGITIATLTVAAGVGPAAHAQEATPQAPVQVGRAAPAWVAQAAPYVQVANYVATIDPAISQHLSPDVVAKVYQTVAQYNRQPLQAREYGYATTNAPRIQATYGACAEYVQVSYYWWGFVLYVNHCVVSHMVAVGFNPWAIAGIIFADCGGCNWFVATLAGAGLAGSAPLVLAADLCGGGGAWLGATWPGFLPPFYWVMQSC